MQHFFGDSDHPPQIEQNPNFHPTTKYVSYSRIQAVMDRYVSSCHISGQWSTSTYEPGLPLWNVLNTTKGIIREFLLKRSVLMAHTRQKNFERTPSLLHEVHLTPTWSLKFHCIMMLFQEQDLTGPMEVFCHMDRLTENMGTGLDDSISLYLLSVSLSLGW